MIGDKCDNKTCGYYAADGCRNTRQPLPVRPESAGSTYMYDDIDDLAANTDRNDITARDRYLWRMARLNMPND